MDSSIIPSCSPRPRVVPTLLKGGWGVNHFHPPTQETTALAVEECVTVKAAIAAMNLLCFGGFRTVADDPPKPRRRWVCFLGTTGLLAGLHGLHLYE